MPRIVPKKAPIAPIARASVITKTEISQCVTPRLRRIPNNGRRFITEKVMVLKIRNKATTMAKRLTAKRLCRIALKTITNYQTISARLILFSTGRFLTEHKSYNSRYSLKEHSLG
jgi:hypothetical protein